ncbi:MAG: DNA-binding transcriptional regulator [Verrucomicrobia bacterium]|nr:DNA-binding transcriptional regulator [Verrucomicrobiota bacterium]
MKSKPKARIALAFPLGLAFIERLQQGILDYAQQRGGWTLTRVPEMLSPSIGWLRHWPGDGAIVLVTTRADARIARALRIPAVNLAGHLADASVPTVMVDHLATGKLAAQHFLERRFQRFGFYGTRGKWYSEQRREGFAAVVQQAGGQCSDLETLDITGHRFRWTNQQEELERWLRTLQPPVGILASTDLRAGMVLDACARLGLRVPEDVAVMGVDNDPVACEFCHPALTSVSRNDREVGYQAAALLDRLMRGGRPPEQPVLIAPDGVVRRRSTETLAIEDPHVAAAVRHIRDNLHEQFGVERIAGRTPLSRRRLEHRFKKTLGSTPYALINELRVERARQLLAQPEKRSLTQVAAECGFTELRRLRLVFLRLTGLTPAKYRQQARDTGAASVKPAPTVRG